MASVSFNVHIQVAFLIIVYLQFKKKKNNTKINIRKAYKGTTSIFMSLADKENEGQIQIDNMESYRPFAEPMVEETSIIPQSTTTRGAQRFVRFGEYRFGRPKIACDVRI